MKKIVISLANQILADGIEAAFLRDGTVEPIKVKPTPTDDMVMVCVAVKPAIVLMDVKCADSALGLAGRTETAKQLREKLGKVSICLICDEFAYPTLRKEMIEAQQRGWVNNFFYESVTSSYLVDSLLAMLEQ